MANLKVGLDYFPHIVRSRPMQMIGAEFKEKGDSVMWTIFEEIYIRGCGYFCEWNDDVALMFVQQPWLSVGVNVVSEIIKSMIKRDILNGEMYEKYGILTSAEIQRTYFEAVKRRKDVKAVKEYLLIDVSQISDNVNIISQNVNIIGENVDILKQIKKNKIKVNKSKVDTIPTSSIGLPLENGEVLPVLESEITEFQNHFKNIDVKSEIKDIKKWLEENPSKRRSLSSTRKLVNNWLRKKGEKINEKDRAAPAGYGKDPYTGEIVL